MLLAVSSPNRANMHFVSWTAEGGESDPVGLGQRWPLHPPFQGEGQGLDRKIVGKAVAGANGAAMSERAKFGERLAEHPARRARLLHPQPQIAVGDQDAGAQQDAL